MAKFPQELQDAAEVRTTASRGFSKGRLWATNIESSEVPAKNADFCLLSITNLNMSVVDFFLKTEWHELKNCY